MRVSLLPRLKAQGVANILERIKEQVLSRKSSLEALAEYPNLTSFAASGGAKAGSVAIAIDAELRRIAQNAGFPSNISQSSKAKFDENAAIWLGLNQDLKTGEALRDDVWAFIAIVLAPDLVAWRYTDKSRERFAGGVRNAFQRLWIRGTILDRGEGHPDRWGLIRHLSEDAMVQIFERPSIAGNPELARAVAEGWLKTAEKIGRSAMEDVMRNATKVLRLKNQVIDLTYLPLDELEKVVISAFELAIANLSKARLGKSQPT